MAPNDDADAQKSRREKMKSSIRATGINDPSHVFWHCTAPTLEFERNEEKSSKIERLHHISMDKKRVAGGKRESMLESR